jgi:hypothetical protein
MKLDLYLVWQICTSVAWVGPLELGTAVLQQVP